MGHHYPAFYTRAGSSWCKQHENLLRQRKKSVPLIAIDVYKVEVIGHCHMKCFSYELQYQKEKR